MGLLWQRFVLGCASVQGKGWLMRQRAEKRRFSEVRKGLRREDVDWSGRKLEWWACRLSLGGGWVYLDEEVEGMIEWTILKENLVSTAENWRGRDVLR